MPIVLDDLRQSACEVRPAGAGTLSLARSWDGPFCRATLENRGRTPVSVREVVLAAGRLNVPPRTRLYGEGFQMLSQMGGTLESPEPFTRFTDAGHYRIPQPPGATAVYGLALLSFPAGAPPRHLLLAFTSCHRFTGSIRFFDGRYELVLDTEGLALEPGERWELEECCVLAGDDCEALLAELAASIARHHPRLPWGEVPAGWCSWYWYGPRVTEQDILDNLRVIATRCPDLRYIQIDDGYQPHMGDWLETGERFPQGLRALCARIRDAGFEPAIWVAPFIAEAGSRLAREHPDWLVRSEGGAPLLSSEVSFGGWRNGPWYMLDGTHPGALEYLEHVFATMRHEWGCRYFKLDALTWGALHGGVRYDRRATRVEAYRRGLAAIRRGAGDGSFLLGCNAPMWASLGEVHGMRVSNDVSRSWARITEVARQCFWRGWQHGRLWINDPDCVVLANRPGRPPLTDDELRFHATAVLASGGMVLSGDDTAALSESAWRTLRRLVPPSGVAARFGPDGPDPAPGTGLTQGTIPLPDRRLVCLFNWSDAPQPARVTLPEPCRVADFWSEAELGTFGGEIAAGTIPPHGARVLECVPLAPG